MAATMSGRLRDHSYAALLAGAREASPSVRYDQKGYAPQWEDNLLGCLPLADIARDLYAGAGRELDGKLCAAHSSAALVANTFGPRRTNLPRCMWGGSDRLPPLRFEVIFPTGLGRMPPHLDLLADGDLPVAVESKFTEWMERKPPVFSPSHKQLRRSQGYSPWFGQVRQGATFRMRRKSRSTPWA